MTSETSILPTLRLPDFAQSWESRTIQSLIDDKSIISHLDGNHGELYPRAEEFSEQGVPYIAANDFIDGDVDFGSCKHLPYERAEKFRKGIAKDGDVLFAHNATVGPTAILRIKLPYVILSTTATYYRCDPASIDRSFLRASLQADYFVRQYTRVMSQSTRNQVPISMQRKFSLQIPTLPEQKKIGEFLTSVDERIGLLIKKKALLEDYKKGVMQQLFSQQIRFKDDNGNDFPDWEEKKLGEVCRIKTGKKDVNEGNPDGQYPFFTCAKRHTYSDSYSFDTTAILIAGNGEVGHCMFYKGKFEAYQRTYVLSDFKRSVDYIFPYLNFFFRRTVDQQKQMGAMPYIKLGMLTDFPIPIPSDQQEQTKIANLVAALDRNIERVSEQIAKTQTFKKGLLQQMFV